MTVQQEGMHDISFGLHRCRPRSERFSCNAFLLYRSRLGWKSREKHYVITERLLVLTICTQFPNSKSVCCKNLNAYCEHVHIPQTKFTVLWVFMKCFADQSVNACVDVRVEFTYMENPSVALVQQGGVSFIVKVNRSSAPRTDSMGMRYRLLWKAKRVTHFPFQTTVVRKKWRCSITSLFSHSCG